MRKRCLKIFLVGLSSVSPCWGATTLAFKQWEVSLAVGRSLFENLPNSPGYLNTLATKTNFGLGVGSAELDTFFHFSSPDTAYGAMLGYRIEATYDFINPVATLGYQFTKFNLQADPHDTVTGDLPHTSQNGITIGGGVLMPLTPKWVLRAESQLLFDPCFWMTISLGAGYRF